MNSSHSASLGDASFEHSANSSEGGQHSVTGVTGEWFNKKAFNLGLLLLAAVGIWFYFQGSHSSFITHTNPILGAPGKAVYGYSYFYNGDLFHFYNGDLFHKENIYPLQQMDAIKKGFVGKEGAKRKFTERRFFHAVLGNVLSLVFTPVYAFQALNFILLLVSLTLIYQVSQLLFRDQSISLLASWLYVFSPGLVMFVGDVSPHLLGNTFYFLWAFLLLRSRDRQLSWKEVIGLGGLLALWATSYPSAGYGAAVLFLWLLWKKQFLKALIPVVIMLSMPRLQLALLTTLGIKYGANTEALYFIQGLEAHWGVLTEKPMLFVVSIFISLINFFFIENPVTMLFAIAGFYGFRDKQKILLELLTFVPILIVLPVISKSSARAYIVSGIAITVIPLAAAAMMWLYRALAKVKFKEVALKRLAISGLYPVAVLTFLIFIVYPVMIEEELPAKLVLLAQGFGVLLLLCLPILPPQFRLVRRALGIGMLGAVLVWHVMWGLAPAMQRPVPAFSFTMGAYNTPFPMDFKANYVRYTGKLDRVPASLGGTAEWNDFVRMPAHLSKLPLFPEKRLGPERITKQPERFWTSLYIQSLLFLFFVVTCVGLFSGRERWLIPLGGLALMVSASLWGAAVAYDKRYVSLLDKNITLRGTQSLHGKVKISDDFRGLLEEKLKSPTLMYVQVYVNMTKLRRGKANFQLYGEDFRQRPGNSMGNNLLFEAEEFLALLDEHDNEITFNVDLSGQDERSSLYVGAWQRLLKWHKNRDAVLVNQDGEETPLDWFPAFEIRVRDDKGVFSLLGV